ncbi:MAG: 50S ribosomal protein L20 [Candidatus Dadabacteria bacterium]|nr:MAG: 50S ribosomal protein L20 [Candidatus Dadabacteria bacterium]
MRVKTGVVRRKRHKKMLKAAEGMRGRRKNCFKLAKLAVEKSLLYSYRDRKVRKREMRSLWITRINAAARRLGITYSALMNSLKKANISLNRKTLASIAYNSPEQFEALVKQIQK